ncbi:hypothetical protein OIV58_31975, partial [Burkholderia pseudomallei]|nr:hypothetical protein [Burkholderia pseudomallei]
MNALTSRAAHRRAGMRLPLGTPLGAIAIALIALLAARGAYAQNVPSGPAIVSGTATIATGAANGTTGAIT